MSNQPPHLVDLPPDIVRGAEVLAMNSARAVLFLATTEAGVPTTVSDQSNIIKNLQDGVQGRYADGAEATQHCIVLTHAGLLTRGSAPKKDSSALVATYTPSPYERHIATAGILLDGELANPWPYRDLLLYPHPSTGKPSATSLTWNIYDELLRVPPFTLSPAMLRQKFGLVQRAAEQITEKLVARGCVEVYDCTDTARRMVYLREPRPQHFQGDPRLASFAIANTNQQLRERGIVRLTVAELIEAVTSNPAYGHLTPTDIKNAVINRSGGVQFRDPIPDDGVRRRVSLAINPAKLGAITDLVERLRGLHNPAIRQQGAAYAAEILGEPHHVAYLMAKAKGEGQQVLAGARASGQAIVAYSRAQKSEFEQAAAREAQQRRARAMLLGSLAVVDKPVDANV